MARNSRLTRDQVVTALQAENILARRYFWPGCHRMKPYIDLYPDAKRFLPHSEQVSEQVIVLPAGSTMDDEKVNAVAAVIKALPEA